MCIKYKVIIVKPKATLHYTFYALWLKKFEDLLPQENLYFPRVSPEVNLIFHLRISLYMYIFRTFMQYTIYFTEQHTILQNTPILTGFSTFRKQKHRERGFFRFFY